MSKWPNDKMIKCQNVKTPIGLWSEKVRKLLQGLRHSAVGKNIPSQGFRHQSAKLWNSKTSVDVRNAKLTTLQLLHSQNRNDTL
jgi:hypothetical protein